MSTGSSLTAIERRLRGTLERQLAALRGRSACEPFNALHDAGELIDAARHLSGCALCKGGKPSTPARVVLAPGTPAERTIALGTGLFVGRECAGVEEDQRLVLDDPEISRSHLELHVDPERGQVSAVDKSSNGTLVDNELIERGVPTPLSDGAMLRLGGHELRFEAAGPAAPELIAEDLSRILELAGVIELVGAARGIADGTDSAPGNLTEHEAEVLVMMARGDSDETIAEQLALSAANVEADTRSIFSKLGIPGGPEDNRRVRAVLGYLASAKGPGRAADASAA